MKSVGDGGDGNIEHDDIGASQFHRQMQSGKSMMTSKASSFIIDTIGVKQETIEEEEAIILELLRAGAPVPPDGGYGWVIVFVSFICNLVLDGITCTFGIFLPQMVESFNTGKGQVAWAGSILCGGSLCIGPVVSALTNKYGCRIVCMTGGIIGGISFILSSFTETLTLMLLSYGVLGAIGFGFIYLPNIVSVGYYFEKKRALATGIAVCGSGFGATTFAPLASWLTDQTTWRNVNLIYAGLLFICGLCGSLIRPLEIRREALDDFTGRERLESDPKRRPLLYRMAEDKKHHMELKSIAGSEYFTVQLPDGTMERRLKIPLNIDPGVHSTFNLDQFTMPQTPNLPMSPIHPLLSTITEAEQRQGSESERSSISRGSGDIDMNTRSTGFKPYHERSIEHAEIEDSDGNEKKNNGGIDIPYRINRRGNYNDEAGVHSHQSSYRKSQLGSYEIIGYEVEAIHPTGGGHSKSPQKFNPKMSFDEFDESSGCGMNGSIHRINRYGSHDGSINNDEMAVERRLSLKPVPMSLTSAKLQHIFSSSIHSRGSVSSFVGSRKGSIGSTDEIPQFVLSKVEVSNGTLTTTVRSQLLSIDGSYNSVHRIIRPLSRKDIFYFGSITNLPEYQTPNYRQSILNIPIETQQRGVDVDVDVDVMDRDGTGTKPIVCPRLMSRLGCLQEMFQSFMDFSLMKNPVFLCIALSGVIGMLGFYVPFVYIIDFCRVKDIPTKEAAFLISVIGIMNTLGRIGFGMLSDLPQVNSLYLNNFCLLSMGLAVIGVPFCTNYTSLVIVYIIFGLFLSGFVSLTSIILVDLLGLENLTNSFGLLIFFRGIASVIGSPFGGFLYDTFGSYEISFFVAGAFLITSSLISSIIPFISKFSPPVVLVQTCYTHGRQHLEDIPEIKEPEENSETSKNEINDIDYLDRKEPQPQLFIIDETNSEADERIEGILPLMITEEEKC